MNKQGLFFSFAQSSRPNNAPEEALSFVEIRQRFHFRSIQLGRWVTRQEQQDAAKSFYYALMTLMAILQGPEQLISLRGTLSLQYGKGGRLGVAAHYSPKERCFSLAKNAGPGSIAHEWFHALDHYLGAQAFISLPSFDQGLNYESKSIFASNAWLLDVPMRKHPLNQLLSDCFRVILLDETGHEPSDLVSQSTKVDAKLQQVYFSLPEEMCARAFEAYVEDAGLEDARLINRFLVKGSRHSQEAQLGLYPQGEHRQKINQAFSEYFKVLGAYLNSGC